MSTNSTRTNRTIALLATTTTAVAGLVTCAPNAHAAPAPRSAAVSTTASAAGWVAVQTHAPHARTATIELIRPNGQRATSVTVGSGELLQGVSNDGRRVLTDQYQRSTSTWRVRDLVTHRTTTFKGAYANVQFTNPNGMALLAHPDAGAGTPKPVERLDLAGHRQLTYAHTEGDNYMSSLDGRFLIGTDASNRMVVDSNATGRLLHTLASPKGYGFCQPVRNDSPSSFEATCLRNGSGTISQVFRFSLAGAAPVSLTAALPTGGFGYVDRWVEPSGTWVHAGTGCGSGPLLKVQGRSVRAPRPAVKGALIDVVANRAYTTMGSCEAGTTLSAANLSTGGAVTLFHPTAGRVIDGWVIVDPTI